MADVALSYNNIFSKVQTTLPSCIQAQDAKLLTEIFPTKVSEAIKHCLEISVRTYVTTQIIKGEHTDLGLITTVTKICIDGVKGGLCSPTLPVNVLSDSFDMLTINQCLHLFSFVEANVAVWKEDIFFSHCKTAVLRMCNDLLRRLSRSQNTVFCGRILLFLARFFPFSERSGLNLISEFNLENVTTFTNSEATDQEMKDENDTAASPENGVDTSLTNTLDYTLYAKFWALQDFFRNPPQCFQKPNWKMFTVYANDVLEAFTSFKLDSCRSSSEISKLERSQSTTEPMEGQSEPAEQYFAKYLTNQKLLDLQFSDSNFRRYVLLQMLILTQYLTSTIKFKTESLSSEQVEWVRKTDERVYGLLAETPPDGPAFVNIVKHILKREERWSDWKNDGCPEFKKPALKSVKEEPDVSPSKKKGQKRKLGDMIRDADAKKKMVMGNVEMTRLWNLCPNNLEACKKSERDFVPALETYFTPAIDQITGKSTVKDAEKLVNDSNFGWRGLRLLACRSPHFFTHSASPIATLPEYLTTMIKKLAKELPSQHQDDQGVDEEEEKEDPGVLEESAADVKDEDDEEDDLADRDEIGPITTAEMRVLAENLNKHSSDAWKTLGKKLGFEGDEV
ncbi:unnamed protein product, partial [Meganyctiphanes norvegica]